MNEQRFGGCGELTSLTGGYAAQRTVERRIGGLKLLDVGEYAAVEQLQSAVIVELYSAIG